MKLLTSALLFSILFCLGCASGGLKTYSPPKGVPLATLHIYAPAIRTSAANTELDYEIFRVDSQCNVESLGWVKLEPANHSTTIQIGADDVSFMRLDYFQTDIVLARNSRGEVKFAFKPEANREYTIENFNTRRLFEMNVWEGPMDGSNKIATIDPLEWNLRESGQLVFRGNLNCRK